MHVLGRQAGWCREAAEYGARILATEERNARARAPRPLRRRRSASEHMSTWCARPRAFCWPRRWRMIRVIEALRRGWGVLGDRLIGGRGAGPALVATAAGAARLARPLVAIGAPVGGVLSRGRAPARCAALHSRACRGLQCRRRGCRAWCRRPCEILVNQPTFKVFRVHDPAGSRDYPEPSPRSSMRIACRAHSRSTAARRAGAADPHVDTEVSEKRAQVRARDGLSRGGSGALRPAGRQTLRVPQRAHITDACRPAAYRKKVSAIACGIATHHGPARERGCSL